MTLDTAIVLLVRSRVWHIVHSFCINYELPLGLAMAITPQNCYPVTIVVKIIYNISNMRVSIAAHNTIGAGKLLALYEGPRQ